jgi:hypothetical protein
VAALMVNELAQKDHLHLFSDALNNPPRDVTQILQDILRHFGHTHTVQEINDLNGLLAWVLYARRPLKLAEVNAAVGLESEYGPFLNIRDKIESEFSAYFSVNDSDTGFKGSEEAKLRLAHSSIAGFFRGGEKIKIKSGGTILGVTADGAHLRLLKTCLTLLCAKEQTQTLGPLSDDNKLLKYAANHFLEHLMELRECDIPIEERYYLAKYLIRFFRDDKALDKWLESLDSFPIWTSMSEVDAVWAMVSDQNLTKSFSPEELAWVTDSTASKAQKITGRLVGVIARKFLQTPTSNTRLYKYFLSLNYFKQLVSA